MGRSWIDSAVEGAQRLLDCDLPAAEARALDLAKKAERPSGRVRALAIRVQALAQRERLSAALCLYTETRTDAQKNRVSRVALAELDLEGAGVFIRLGKTSEARRVLYGIRDDLEPAILRAQENRSRGGRIQLRLLQKLLAKSWIASAFAAMEESNPQRAFRDAQKAATLSDHVTIQLSALSLLSLAASTHPEPGTLAAVLRLVNEAETRLARRGNPPSFHLAKLRWIRALTLERAGLPEDADEIMTAVVEWFVDSDYREDAKRARADWERIRTAARAEYRRRNTSKQ